ncbi:unnamed protein product [Cyclocybe aegerita]|uniref:Protein kinase domain-containing protein n=1 Tax=Cyclocybe aegerita TaxID=1973307 RepID=A0A8S0WH55_CYCAE|nr:unnamed protein product [Cyclocybe aegerita]
MICRSQHDILHVIVLSRFSVKCSIQHFVCLQPPLQHLKASNSLLVCRTLNAQALMLQDKEVNVTAADDAYSKLPETYEMWQNLVNTLFPTTADSIREKHANARPEKFWWYPWMTLRPFFKSKGYTLFDYDISKKNRLPKFEGSPALDSFGLFGNRDPKVMERTWGNSSTTAWPARDEQNRDVMIKVVAKTFQECPEGSTELRILKFLSSSAMRADPRNSTIKILEFHDYHGWQFVVMPYLDCCADYPFLSLKECLDFACQLLDTLAFLHENKIAHLDISHENILMNHHGALPRRECITEEAILIFDPVPEFRSTFPVKYFMIDFGNSVFFSPGLIPSECLVPPKDWGRPHRAPETSGHAVFNPFAADVYQTAQFFYIFFGKAISPAIPGLLELLQDMASDQPSERISMGTAASRMRKLYETLLRENSQVDKVVVELADFEKIPRRL